MSFDFDHTPVPDFGPQSNPQPISFDISLDPEERNRLDLVAEFVRARPDFLDSEANMEILFDRVRQVEKFLMEVYENPDASAAG
jgi:hypothetical protein